MSNVAIIGMGNMGCNYASMISKGNIPHMKLVAVTRIKQNRYETLKNELASEIQIFQSSDLLFKAYDDGTVVFDAVIIVTPHYSHEEIAVEAFKRGISVLCDKPVGVYTRQARNMIEAYKNAKASNPDLKFGLVFQQRTCSIYKKLREIVISGQYGALKRVNWIVTDWYRPSAYYKSGTWKATWKGDGGGVVLNQCPHNLDLLQWICGMPVSVQGYCKEGKYHPIEVEDEVTAYMEWKNGATGVFISSTGEATGINRLEISLDNAMLICENNEIKILELDKPESEYRAEEKDFFTKPKVIEKVLQFNDDINPYVELLENFAIGKNIAEGEEGINSLYLSNGIYLSSWENRKIFMPEFNTPEEKDFESSFENHLNNKIAGK